MIDRAELKEEDMPMVWGFYPFYYQIFVSEQF